MWLMALMIAVYITTLLVNIFLLNYIPELVSHPFWNGALTVIFWIGIVTSIMGTVLQLVLLVMWAMNIEIKITGED